MKRGIIQVYTGDGKGKTTAAIGLAVRAWGRGLRVKIFQFLKAPGGSGEHWALPVFSPVLPIYPLGSGEFIIDREPTPEELAQAQRGWDQIEETLCGKTVDLLVIDELSHAVNTGLLKLETVLDTLRRRPKEVELVLTGRNMPGPILELAELITEMKAVKHPYRERFGAREGIEY